MKRTYTLATAVLACLASAASVAAAQGSTPTARAARAATVNLRSTSMGRILVNASGFTLYEFTRDHGDRDSCMGISGCARSWPALETSGRPNAGAGVRASLLSTIRLPGGASQVTYAGHPLYRYSEDSAPGDTEYVGANAFGGNWNAINASGHAVR